MRLSKLLGLGLAALASTALLPTAQGGLLITEFIADPSGTDIDREWFEIYNPDPVAIDLTGYAAGDGTNPTSTSTGEAMGEFPGGTMINPGQVMVIAANANGFQGLYGFFPDFEFANSTSTLGLNATVPDLIQKAGWGVSNASLAIANGGDDVGILLPGSDSTTFTFADGSNHGTVTTFFTGAALLGSNQSYERVPPGTDTNTASDWVVRTTGTATPGQIPEPATASLAAIAAGLLALRRRHR
jgi:hypothetical protein